MTYNRFINGLKKAGVDINRKMLAGQYRMPRLFPNWWILPGAMWRQPVQFSRFVKLRKVRRVFRCTVAPDKPFTQRGTGQALPWPKASVVLAAVGQGSNSGCWCLTGFADSERHMLSARLG